MKIDENRIVFAHKCREKVGRELRADAAAAVVVNIRGSAQQR
jgi:hypothetical protein